MKWETVPLGEIARYVRGVTYKPADVVLDEGIACLRTKNIQSVLDLRDLVYVDEHVTHRLEQRVQPDDVLVSSANSWHLVGRAVRATQAAAGMLIGGFIGALRFNTARIDPAFGYRWFSSPEVQARVRSFGQQTTNIANLNVDRTLRLDIPLPPLPEQRRIAAILDEADALRSTWGATRESARRAISSRISALLSKSTDIKPLAQLLAEPMRNGISPSRGGRYEGEVLTLSAITRGAFDPRQRKSDLFAAPHAADKLAIEGLHLICRGNGNAELVGAMVAVTDQLDGVAFPDTMIGFRPSSEINSPTLVAAWRHPTVRDQLRRAARTTNGTYKVNQQSLASVTVPVPRREDQEQIAALDAERAKLDSQLAQGLVSLDELFASLQHRAFRGEL